MQKPVYYTGSARSHSMWDLETPTPDYGCYMDTGGGRYNADSYGYGARSSRLTRARSMKESAGLNDPSVDPRDYPPAKHGAGVRPGQGPRRATSQYSLPPNAGDAAEDRAEMRQAQSQYNLYGREWGGGGGGGEQDRMRQAHSCYNVQERRGTERRAPVRQAYSTYNVRHRGGDDDDIWWGSQRAPTWAQFRPPPRGDTRPGPPPLPHQECQKYTSGVHQEKVGKFTPPPPYQDKYHQSYPENLPPGAPMSYDQVVQEYGPYHAQGAPQHRSTPDPDYDRTPPQSTRNGKYVPPPVVTSEKQIQNGSVRHGNQHPNVTSGKQRDIGFKFTDMFNTSQPVVGVPRQQAPTYMILSIVTTLCCGVAIGLIAVWYSYKTMKRNKAGLFDQAWKSSKFAWIWALIAAMIGCTVIATLIALGLLQII